MYRSVLLTLVTLLTVLSPAQAQFRAIQSSSGGIATSSSYSTRATIGEPVEGLALTSDQDTLITGFYLVIPVDDGGGGIDNIGPQIFFVEIGDQTITPLSEVPPSPLVQPENVAIPVATQITDAGSGVEQATLFFRQGGMSSFTEQAMSISGNLYTGTIEAGSVGSRGLEYYIVAQDSVANQSRTPLSGTHDIRVRIDAPGLEQSFLGDTTLAGYRLIAVPLDLTNKASSNVLSELGTNYDDRFWRFWRLKDDYADFQGQDQYEELKNGTSFNPGDAFWLISRENWAIQTGQAVSLPTSEPFTKNLHAGWNFFSNPFDFSIPLQNVSLSTGATPEIKSYQQDWESTFVPLVPFSGYAIDAGENEDVVLTIDPTIGGTGGKQSLEPVTQINAFAWGIRIMAEGNIARDRNNYIATSSQASVGWDVFDRPEPPVIGDFVSVSFPHADWGKIHRRYETDVRPIPTYGDEWQFDVVTGLSQVVQLTFEGVDDVPLQFGIQLIDEINKTTLDLRTQTSYTVRTEAGKAYPLAIQIGESGYIEEQIESKNLLPDAPTLDQNYPNPFNPTTSIRYGLTGPSRVTLVVYNSLGQVVSTLVDGVTKDAGYHIATWNALSDDGSAVSSGLYLYRLSVSPERGSTAGQPAVLTRKMMLIK